MQPNNGESTMSESDTTQASQAPTDGASQKPSVPPMAFFYEAVAKLQERHSYSVNQLDANVGRDSKESRREAEIAWSFLRGKEAGIREAMSIVCEEFLKARQAQQEARRLTS